MASEQQTSPEHAPAHAGSTGSAGHPHAAGHPGIEVDEEWLIESIERRVEAFEADAGDPAEAEIEAASALTDPAGHPEG
jgi:hypothetical protein